MKARALTISMEFSVIPRRIQMERIITVECFRRKKFFPEFQEISVPFVRTVTSARLLTVILLRKNAKDQKDSGRFPKRLPIRCSVYLFSLVVLAEVLEHNCSPAGEKELSFAVGTFVFLLLTWLGPRACVWASSRNNTVDADCWFYWRNVDTASAKKMKLSSSSVKIIIFQVVR